MCIYKIPVTRCFDRQCAFQVFPSWCLSKVDYGYLMWENVPLDDWLKLSKLLNFIVWMTVKVISLIRLFGDDITHNYQGKHLGEFKTISRFIFICRHFFSFILVILIKTKIVSQNNNFSDKLITRRNAEKGW